LLTVVIFSSFYFTLIRFSIFSVLLCLVALFLLILENGIIIDVENKRFKKAVLYKNFSRGKWQDFPDVRYISVFKTTLVNTSHSISYQTIERKHKVILVNIIYDKNKRLNVYQTLDDVEAMDIAKRIANKLNVKIFNAISYKKNWIDVSKTEAIVLPE